MSSRQRRKRVKSRGLTLGGGGEAGGGQWIGRAHCIRSLIVIIIAHHHCIS